MNSKNTKRALVTSLLALILCFSMLIGTTYAWFTDSVTSGNNRILAGNLDIELYNGLDNTAEKVTTNTKLFDGIKLWEPGVVAYENLTVANVGTLALKYDLAVNFLNENATTDGHKLSDILKVAVVKGGVKDVSDDAAGRSKLIESIAAADWKTMGSFVETGSLYSVETAAADAAKASSATYGIVIYWQPSATDNDYNVNNGKTTTDGQPLHIDLGVTLFATQEEYESDSFNAEYDKNAPSLFTVNGIAYETAEAALAAAVDGDTVVLSNVKDPITVDKAITLKLANTNVVAASGNAVTVTANATVEISGYVNLVGASGAHGIAVADGVALTLTGTGNLIAAGNNGTENTVDKVGGSGIYGAETASITIDGLTALSAYGYGQAGFGIGGATKSVTINNTNVNYAKGGYVQANFVNDAKYGKNEPEGGAAIGSMTDGAVITITDSTVASAIGGSKAAGIGARFWTGVTVNITDSTVNAIGGNASAGIGGSRVSNGATDAESININIVGSTVTAVGGQGGAGIGSGYDTYCQSKQPLCTVNIDGSDITAQGGKYAAGVGSGYHNAALAGEIKNSTVNAASGEKFYKDSYTQAMDIGFGVVDPAREGAQTDSKLIYNGTEIRIPGSVTVTDWVDLFAVNTDTTVENQVAKEYVEICHNGGNLVMKNVTFKNGLTIYTENASNTGSVTLENCTIYLNNGSGDPAHTGYTQVNADYGLNLNLVNGSKITFIFKNCTFTAADDHEYADNDKGYNVYIGGGYSAESVTFEGCTFEKSAKHAIGCSSQADSNYYTLNVTGCNFKDWNNQTTITNGAAIRGNLPADDFAANITISGNTFGNSNNSTQQTVLIERWTGSWN